MAKKKNALTPEQRVAYLAQCEDLVNQAQVEVDALCAGYSGLPDIGLARSHLRWFNATGSVLTGRQSRLNQSLDWIQSPKETEDYSQEHLAKYRDLCHRLRELRQLCLTATQGAFLKLQD